MLKINSQIESIIRTKQAKHFAWNPHKNHTLSKFIRSDKEMSTEVRLNVTPTPLHSIPPYPSLRVKGKAMTFSLLHHLFRDHSGTERMKNKSSASSL